MKNILIYLLTIIIYFVYTTEAKQCYCNCTIDSNYEIKNSKKTSEIIKNKTKRTQGGYKKIMNAARALKKEIGNLEKSQRHISSYRFRDLSLSKILN